MPIINQIVKGGGGSAPDYYITLTKNANNQLNKATFLPDLTGVDDLGGYCFAYAWRYTYLSGNADLSGLKKLTGSSCLQHAFYQTRITGLDMSNIEEITGNDACQGMCYSCSSLTGAFSMPKLKKIGNAFGSAFWGCNFTSINLKSFEEFTSYSGLSGTFEQNKNLVTVQFESLYKMNYAGVMNRTFASCTSLQSLWFYALDTNSFGSPTNQFDNMLSGVTGCTVHFPIRIQSTIGSWTSVTNGFNGTNTTVLFDIVTSLVGADTNTYTRSEKNSTSTATAWLYNDTLYYTSGVSNHTAGVNEPSVGDTIYSDDACTTAVTTISSIA